MRLDDAKPALDSPLPPVVVFADWTPLPIRFDVPWQWPFA